MTIKQKDEKKSRGLFRGGKSLVNPVLELSFSGRICFESKLSVRVKKAYHENEVAQASSLQTRCLRYVFIIRGVVVRRVNPSEMTTWFSEHLLVGYCKSKFLTTKL